MVIHGTQRRKMPSALFLPGAEIKLFTGMLTSLSACSNAGELAHVWK
jgi:hypothetical protein